MHRIARLAAATFVLAGGYIHFDLWRDGYRAIDYIGPLFVANAVVSVLLVLALLVRPDVRVAVAGVVFSVASASTALRPSSSVSTSKPSFSRTLCVVNRLTRSSSMRSIRGRVVTAMMMLSTGPGRGLRQACDTRRFPAP